jgi:hypothetical protein
LSSGLSTLLSPYFFSVAFFEPDQVKDRLQHATWNLFFGKKQVIVVALPSGFINNT